MASSLLAFNDLFMGAAQPERARHRHHLVRSRSLRGALVRMAAAPLALAIVAGGVILSQDAAPPREIAAPPSAYGAVLIPRKPVAAAPVLRGAVNAHSFDDDDDTTQAAVTWARRLPEEALSPNVALFAPDAAPGVLQFGPMRIKRDLVETVVRAARDTDTDPTLLMAIADKESAFAPTVKASTSSATGLFQFIDSTWLRVVRDFGAEFGLEREAALIDSSDGALAPSERRRILAMRNNPYLSALLAAKMLKHDAAKISARIGRDLSGGETYLAHFLGPSDAERFIYKLETEPHYAAPKLLPKPARANRSIFYGAAHRRAKALTVADVHRKFETMMDLRAERYRGVEKLTGLTAYAPVP